MKYEDLRVGQVLRYSANAVRTELFTVQVTSVDEFDDFSALILKDESGWYQEGTVEQNFGPEYFEIYVP